MAKNIKTITILLGSKSGIYSLLLEREQNRCHSKNFKLYHILI
jgi:hypothetical protein